VHLAALRAHGDRLPVGVTVLVEGEEEIGSPALPEFLAAYAPRLRADVLVLADSINWTVDVPALTTSLRGGANVTVEVRALHHGVHSGAYGGPVPDALTALCRLLATLHDERGDVAVAGLARGRTGPLDLTEERLRADAGMLAGVHLIGTGSLTERLWAHPAIAVIGVDAPAVRAASNTLSSGRPCQGEPAGSPRRRRSQGTRGPRNAPEDIRAMGRARERRARRHGRALCRARRRAGVPGRARGPGQRGGGGGGGGGGEGPGRGYRRRRFHRVRHRLRGPPSATPRSSSPGSRTQVPGRTARTRAWTWRCSSAPAWPRRCCCATWPGAARCAAVWLGAIPYRFR